MVRPRLAALLVLLVLGVGGCWTHSIDLGRDCTEEEAKRLGCYICPYTCVREADDGGALAEDAGADAGDLGLACDGQCVPWRPVGWVDPVLLWLGPGSEIPSCPPQAPDTGGYAWYGDLQIPPTTCGACSCEPPVGTCTLPTKMSTSSAICPGSDSMAAHFSFDAPGGWAGACTTLDALDAGKTCDGLPCIESLTIAPLSVTAGPCTAVAASSMPLLTPLAWGTIATVCQGTATGSCHDPSKICVPADAPGFERCVSQVGDLPCAPMGPYTVRHVLYTDVSDTRGCAPCTCGEAVGSSCSTKLSVFEDSLCADLLGTFPIDTTGPKCHDLPPGIGLKGKSAEPPIFTPGVCQPGGGGPAGAAEPLNPTTYCCLPTH
jgi:hypothetical protein